MPQYQQHSTTITCNDHPVFTVHCSLFASVKFHFCRIAKDLRDSFFFCFVSFHFILLSQSHALIFVIYLIHSVICSLYLEMILNINTQFNNCRPIIFVESKVRKVERSNGENQLCRFVCLNTCIRINLRACIFALTMVILNAGMPHSVLCRWFDVVFFVVILYSCDFITQFNWCQNTVYIASVRGVYAVRYGICTVAKL